MTKYLKTKEGSIEDVVKQMQNKVMENDYQDKFKKELDKAGKPLGQMTGAEKKSFFNKIDKNNFALAVSGGSDSLCLAYFRKIYSNEVKNKIHVLIVNHNLRKESQIEASHVRRILKKKGIQSCILNWKDKIPKNNIQSNARNMRYSLIADYC